MVSGSFCPRVWAHFVVAAAISSFGPAKAMDEGMNRLLASTSSNAEIERWNLMISPFPWRRSWYPSKPRTCPESASCKEVPGRFVYAARTHREERRMWNQVYNPFSNEALSTLVAAITVVTLLALIASDKVKANFAEVIALAVA